MTKNELLLKVCDLLDQLHTMDRYSDQAQDLQKEIEKLLSCFSLLQETKEIEHEKK